jgi:hypothetical protein
MSTTSKLSPPHSKRSGSCASSSAARAPVSASGHTLEAGLARGDDGDLRHCEDVVGREQHDDENNLEEYGTHNPSPYD